MEDNIIKKSKTVIEPGGADTTEEIQIKKAEKIINNWLEIQKTVKTLQSLEEMMEEQHEDHKNKLESIVREHFTLKIKSRKLYNDIKDLKLDAENNASKKISLDYYVEEKSDTILIGAKESITKFLFIIRENFDYIPRIAALVEEKKNREKMESIAELFCNQFYDNLLIPNPEQEELLLCIFKLLEFEINRMCSSNVEQFLNDSTFIGTFMTVFSKQHDLNAFVQNLINKVMFAIENKNEGCFDISLYGIQRYFRREEKKKKDEENEKKDKKEKKNSEDKKEILRETEEDKKKKKKDRQERDKLIVKLFQKLEDTKICFRKNIELEAEIEEENKKAMENIDASKMVIDNDEDKDKEEPKNEINIIVENKENKENKEKKDEIKTDEKKQNIECGDELSFRKIVEKIKKIKNEDLKAFYIYLLDQIVDDPNTFCREKFDELLKDESYLQNYEALFKKLNENIIFIREQVESLLQSLIDKLQTIPYVVRCICKMIDVLISKKFPQLPKYLRHSFIGKFLLNKCIFPVFSLENKTTLKKVIFSSAQRRCLLSIMNIISTANQCLLYSHYNDPEKIPFNNYLIQIIPILNKFYDKLVDLRLPNQLNEYLSHSFEGMEDNSFVFGAKKKSNEKKKKSQTTYDYFAVNPDEILRLENICFTVDDVIFLKDLVDDNEDKFKDLPKFYNLKKAVDEIDKIEYRIDEARKKNEKPDSKCFLLLYKYDKKPELDEFLTRKKSKKNKDLLWRIKDCIKVILRGLNLLDIKDYSYLSIAVNNEKFFQAIHYTLKDIGEEDGVPLNWYSKFFLSNKSKLPEEYLENDLKKLYDEINTEEDLLTKKRNHLNSYMNAREGMNIQCSKKSVEKSRYDLKKLEQTKQFQKIETFISIDQTQVCIRVNDKIETEEEIKEKKGNEALNNFKSLLIKSEKESTQYVQIVDANNCEHRSENFMAKIEGKRDTVIKTHAKKVNQFISKFSDPNSPVKKLRTLIEFIRSDIEKGEPEHKIYLAFEEYKELIKKSIRENSKKNNLIESKDSKTQKRELNEIANRIEDHIMCKIYKYVFPIKRSKHLEQLDNEFFEKTIIYEWIPPENLGVKIQITTDVIELAKESLLQMEETAQSINEKINCIKGVYININKAMQFGTGKVEKLSMDDQLPLLVFIVIQAHPKRFISNIHYMNCFFNPNSEDKLLLDNIISCADAIKTFTHESLNIKEEEFTKKVNEAKEQLKNLRKPNK